MAVRAGRAAPIDMSADTSFTLTRLLAWLDDDPVRASEKYVVLHRELSAYLAEHGAHSVCEALADEALNRVDKSLATALLNEHYNSTELLDVPGLCRAVAGESEARGPGGRIWRLLPETGRALLSSIAQTGTFQLTQRSQLSQALNELLRRDDFYNAEDFDLPALSGKAGGTTRKIADALERGVQSLSQHEIEELNRRLLTASYPGLVKTPLYDTPEEEKLPRCKRYARLVLKEYNKSPATMPPKPEGEATADDPLGIVIRVEDAREHERMLACQEECLRRKLSPRDRVVLEMYFTGINILSRDDEALKDRVITDVRKHMAAERGVPAETIRTIAHRAKKSVLDCIKRCMGRWKNI